MTIEQEHIEEMKREIKNGFRKADCRTPYTNEPYPYFETQITTIAETLYDEGYRKVDEFEKLKAENEQLKAKLEARLTCSFVKARQNYAVQEFVEKLKDCFSGEHRCYICSDGYTSIGEEINEKIDELLKEYK